MSKNTSKIPGFIEKRKGTFTPGEIIAEVQAVYPGASRDKIKYYIYRFERAGKLVKSKDVATRAITFTWVGD